MLGRPFVVKLIVPATRVVLSIPMILQKVPRNHWYGFRTPYTLSSDAAWYHANRISGIATLIAGLAWFALALALPNVISSPELARRLRAVAWIRFLECSRTDVLVAGVQDEMSDA